MTTSYLIHENRVAGRRLGRHVEHDPRSRLYRLPMRAAASVSHERMIPVLDQGNLGSCTGNAGTGAVGSAPLYAALPAATQKGLLDAKAAEAWAVALYSAATGQDDVPGQYKPNDTGSTGLAVGKVLKARGAIAGYVLATSAAEMASVLQAGPVIIGIPWTDGFDNPRASDGLVTIAGSVRGGHEIVVDEYDAGTDTFTATNSWGTGWGDAGRFRFTGGTMDALFRQNADCYGFVPASEPAPTPAPAPVTPTGPVWPAATVDPWLAKRHTGSTAPVAAALKTYRDALEQA